MYDDRHYQDRFSRYAASNAVAATGQQQVSYPAVATSAASPCLFNSKGGQWKITDDGEALPYDATIRVPWATTLLPSTRSDLRDKIIVTTQNGVTVSRTFTVLAVTWAAGTHKIGYLKEVTS